MSKEDRYANLTAPDEETTPDNNADTETDAESDSDTVEFVEAAETDAETVSVTVRNGNTEQEIEFDANDATVGDLVQRLNDEGIVDSDTELVICEQTQQLFRSIAKMQRKAALAPIRFSTGLLKSVVAGSVAVGTLVVMRRNNNDDE